MATKEKGVSLIRRLEAANEGQVTIDSLRPLQGLHTPTARARVLHDLSGSNISMKAFREACAAAVYEMWMAWQWEGALENDMVDPEKRVLGTLGYFILCYYILNYLSFHSRGRVNCCCCSLHRC